ncbi:hypothetical protein Tco_1135159 [Tanacetum coccineum]
MVAAKKSKDNLKAKELAAKYRATGTVPKKLIARFGGANVIAGQQGAVTGVELADAYDVLTITMSGRGGKATTLMPLTLGFSHLFSHLHDSHPRAVLISPSFSSELPMAHGMSCFRSSWSYLRHSPHSPFLKTSRGVHVKFVLAWSKTIAIVPFLTLLDSASAIATATPWLI